MEQNLGFSENFQRSNTPVTKYTINAFWDFRWEHYKSCKLINYTLYWKSEKQQRLKRKSIRKELLMFKVLSLYFNTLTINNFLNRHTHSQLWQA